MLLLIVPQGAPLAYTPFHDNNKEMTPRKSTNPATYVFVLQGAPLAYTPSCDNNKEMEPWKPKLYLNI